MEDKNTVVTATVAVGQNYLELSITTVIYKAERGDVICCIFSELQSAKSSVFTLL